MILKKMVTKLIRRELEPPYYGFGDTWLTHRTLVVTFLETDEGVSGFGVAPGSEAVNRFVNQHLKHVVIGRDPLLVERLWSLMSDSVGSVDRDVALKAISSVDLALYDIIGKSLDVPVWKLLGGYGDRVRAFATIGHYHQGKGLDDLSHWMSWAARKGFRAVKMKIGRLDIKEELERVRTAREAVGSEVLLMVDANWLWPPNRAIEFIGMAEKYDIYWFEDPTPSIKGIGDVAKASKVPVAAGEPHPTFAPWGYSLSGHRDLMGSVDMLVADASLYGGVTPFKKSAALAEAFGIPIISHTADHFHQSIVSAFSNGLCSEVVPNPEYNPLSDFGPDPLYTTPIVLREGYIDPPDRPGFGLELNQNVLEKFEQHTS